VGDEILIGTPQGRSSSGRYVRYLLIILMPYPLSSTRIPLAASVIGTDWFRQYLSQKFSAGPRPCYHSPGVTRGQERAGTWGGVHPGRSHPGRQREVGKGR